MVKRHKSPNAGDTHSTDGGDPVVLERVQELTWALVDEQITDDEFRLLENLLLSDDKAVGSYINCMQLHVDLIGHFAESSTASTSAAPAKTPVLGFLNAGASPLDPQSPSAEDAAT